VWLSSKKGHTLSWAWKNFPNILALVRMLLALPVIMLCVCDGGALYPAILLFSLAIVTDLFDGYIARRWHVESELGAYLDPMADKILICGVLAAFVYRGTISWLVVALIVMRDIVVTLLRSLALKQGWTLKTTRLAQRKTFLQAIAIYALFIQCMVDNGQNTVVIAATLYVVYAVVALTLYTGLDYLISYCRVACGNQKQR